MSRDPAYGRPVLRGVWSRTDWGLVIAALGLSIVGALLVWSATRHVTGTSTLLKHLVNLGVGVGCFAVVTRIDHRTLRAWAPWAYVAAVLGLVAVLSPLGSTINGSRSWIQIPGGFSIQPSELVKVALCVGLAMILAEPRDRDQAPGVRDLVLAWVGVAVWFGVQAFENIGMNLGMMPVTGLPLPFLSYGGSSMFAAWLALGLVNTVHVAATAAR